MNETIAKQKVTPKKMNALNARGLNAVKQRIKKNNKEYQAQIDEYRANKEEYMWSDDEEEEPVKTKPKTSRTAVSFANDAAEDDDEGFATVGKGGRTLIFTPESIFKHLRSIMESRGKKNTDRPEQIKIMEKLNEIAATPYQRIRVLLTLVSARFDLGSGAATSMSLDHWKAAEKELAQLFTTLKANREYIVVENAEEWEDDEKPPALEGGQKYIKVPGSIVSYIERLDDELTRSLQAIDPHTSEYIERLTDEGSLYNIIFQGQLYYEMLREDASLEIDQDSINRIVIRRLEHVYFKVIYIRCTVDATLLTACSLLPSLKSSRRTPGRLSKMAPTRQYHPGQRRPRRRTLSMSFPTTFSPTARAFTVLAQCCATFTSLLCMTTTTRLVT